jgi:multiple sugar transport system permease protein
MAMIKTETLHKARSNPKLSVNFEKIVLYATLTFLSLIVIFPFIYMVMTSLKPEMDVVTFPPRLLPRALTLENYINIWSRVPFGIFFRNSVFFAGGVTLLSLFFDSLCAFGLARLKLPGKDIIFFGILATMMVPVQVTMIPLFITIFQIGWINTLAGLILPRATNAFGIFLLRQFFISLPKELEDAARIDGCSDFRIYWQIILPLSKPAIATLAVFHFMYNWNDFLWPLIMTTSVDKRTLPAGLALFMGQHVIEYAILMAGAAISLAPLLIAFLFAQKYFVQGIALTGLKE